MEVLNKLKELSKERFEDNFYLCLGLLFLITFQLIRNIFIMICKLTKLIFNKITKKVEETK